MKKWTSVHIFFKGDIYSYDCDRIILDVVNPFIIDCFNKNWIDSFFFIRYFESGSHVRLRFYGESEVLDSELKSSCCQFIANQLPKELLDYPFKKNRLTQNKRPMKDSMPYLWVPYKPEIYRYGGNEAIKVAEDFFNFSSKIVLELLCKIEKGNNSSRLGFGLILMVITLYVFFCDIDQVKTFLKNYSEGYLKARSKQESEIISWQDRFDQGFEKQSSKLIVYVTSIWHALDENMKIGEPFDYYIEKVLSTKINLKGLSDANKIIRYNNIEIIGRENTYRNIVPSYLHMNNNRLGISIPEEAYLAHIILKSF